MADDPREFPQDPEQREPFSIDWSRFATKYSTEVTNTEWAVEAVESDNGADPDPLAILESPPKDDAENVATVWVAGGTPGFFYYLKGVATAGSYRWVKRIPIPIKKA